jgi:hypothetical protein
MTIRAASSRLLRETSGTTLALVAAAISALIGITGLGVETGLWYTINRYNQSAADVAALSGALEKAGGKPYSDLCNLAELAAKANGFSFVSFSCPTSTPACSSPATGQMCANNPPVLGPNTTNATAVEVILAQQQNTFFASLFLPSVTIDTRAVAGLKAFPTCMLALNLNGQDLTAGGGGSAQNLTLTNCSFISDSNSSDSIRANGNVKITAAAIDTVGGTKISGSSNSISPPITTIPNPVADPYAGAFPAISTLLTGLTTNGCPSVTGGSTTLTPGLYGGSCAKGSTAPMSLTGGATTLCSGVYFLDGEDNKGEALLIDNTGTTVTMGTPGTTYGTVKCPTTQTINGTAYTIPFGITMIATSTAASCSKTNCGGGLVIGGTGSSHQPTVTLAAPTTTGLGGTIPLEMLFYQEASTADTKFGNSVLAGGSAVSLNGVVYTKATQIGLNGNPTFGSCTELIAGSFSLGGTPSMSAPSCGIVTASATTLVLLE